MSIKAMVSAEQRKLDREWHIQHPKGMFQVSVMKKDRWNMKGFGYNVVVEIITKRPTSRSRASMGVSIQEPEPNRNQWPLSYCYNRTIYGDFESMRRRLQELNFPMEVFAKLEAWWIARYR